MRAEPNHLYVMEGGGFHKIGIAANPIQRAKDLNLPFEIRVIHSIKVDKARIAEEILHVCFAHKRIRGEWFHLEPIDLFLIRSLRTFDDFLSIRHLPMRFEFHRFPSGWAFV